MRYVLGTTCREALAAAACTGSCNTQQQQVPGRRVSSSGVVRWGCGHDMVPLRCLLLLLLLMMMPAAAVADEEGLGP